MEIRNGTWNQEAGQLQKRAKAILAMGRVERVGDRFFVATPNLKGRRKSFEVCRNEHGQVVCECPEFDAIGPGNGFRCEHIIAVKFALVSHNTDNTGGDKVREANSRDRDVIPPVKTDTESRESGRGEQEPPAIPLNDLNNGQLRSQIDGVASVKDTKGEIEMKTNNLKEVWTEETPAGSDAHNDNVLSFSATLKELRRNVDPRLVRQREGWRDRRGNIQMVDYVEWHTVADILDETAPNWAHTVKDIRQIGDIMTVTVAITIDGVTREGVGTGNVHNEMGIKKAEHDALKRAAVKFGIARDLYKKESDVIEREGATAGNNGGFPSEPIAQNLNELVTAKQIGMIKAVARDIRVDPNGECQAVMSCNVDELSKKAASALIQHLKDIQRHAESAGEVPLRKAG